MPLTDHQRAICRLLAARRIERGESYVPGGSALNLLASGNRLSRTWRNMLEQAREIISLLPFSSSGACVINAQGELYRESSGQLKDDLAAGNVNFHPGCIGGAFPVPRNV